MVDIIYAMKNRRSKNMFVPDLLFVKGAYDALIFRHFGIQTSK